MLYCLKLTKTTLKLLGGWAGGSAASKDFIKNADLMWKQSIWSSTISAKIANIHLKSGGILVLPGAHPALEGTPGMIGYGMAKAAVHQLTKSLAEPKSGMPENSRVNMPILCPISYKKSSQNTSDPHAKPS